MYWRVGEVLVRERRPRDSCHDGLAILGIRREPRNSTKLQPHCASAFVMVLTVGEFDSSETEVAAKDHLPLCWLSSNSNHRVVGLKSRTLLLQFDYT